MNLVWHWPQITMACVFAFSLLLTAAFNGQKRTGEYNFALSLIIFAGEIFLLYQGGFWAGATP